MESGGYVIRPLEAVHGDEHECVTHLVEGRRSLLYGRTPALPRVRLEHPGAVSTATGIIDSTMGHLGGGSHLGFEQVKETVARLRQIAGADMRAIAHHFSHKLTPPRRTGSIYAGDHISVPPHGMIVDRRLSAVRAVVCRPSAALLL